MPYLRLPTGHPYRLRRGGHADDVDSVSRVAIRPSPSRDLGGAPCRARVVPLCIEPETSSARRCFVFLPGLRTLLKAR